MQELKKEEVTQELHSVIIYCGSMIAPINAVEFFIWATEQIMQ